MERIYAWKYRRPVKNNNSANNVANNAGKLGFDLSPLLLKNEVQLCSSDFDVAHFSISNYRVDHMIYAKYIYIYYVSSPLSPLCYYRLTGFDIAIGS